MKEITLTQETVTLVDDEDFEWLSRHIWFFAKGYAARGARSLWGKLYLIYMHRVIMEAPKGFVVDHRDCNKLNNQRANLRLVTPRQNCYNKPPHRDNKSGYKGVFKINIPYAGDLWTARITVNKQMIDLGVFQTPEQAAVAYNKAAQEHHGEFAYLNIMEGK
jgi:HNH endonuclease